MARSSKGFATYLVIALAALLLAGTTSAQEGSLQQDKVYTIDDEYLDLSREYPGFGGLFYDEEGVANIYVTQGAKRHAIAAQAEGEFNFIPAEFSWAELFEVRDRIFDVMNEEGVVFLDIDERANRVTIGLSNTSRERSAERRVDIASRFGVNERALRIVETEPVINMVSLRGQVRPMPAGLQIEFGSSVCTIGFIIKQGSTRGFVTNSHCTLIQGGTENTDYSQGFAGIIASEIQDPNYGTTSGCPSGRRCRLSDSAMAQFNGNDDGLGQFARIARPGCRNCGSLTIGNNGNERFKITASGNTDGTLHKVGRTTGWTSGAKIGTCQTTNVSHTNITLLCQDRVRAGVGGGDSGSGVFKRLGGNKVRLVGLLWGGTSSGTEFVYSPINQVRSELGSFSVK